MRQRKLLCLIAVQDLKRHAIDNVDNEGLDVNDTIEETGAMF